MIDLACGVIRISNNVLILRLMVQDMNPVTMFLSYSLCSDSLSYQTLTLRLMVQDMNPVTYVQGFTHFEEHRLILHPRFHMFPGIKFETYNLDFLHFKWFSKIYVQSFIHFEWWNLKVASKNSYVSKEYSKNLYPRLLMFIVM